MKIISRSGGRSAVATAAYRAGEKLLDRRVVMEHDFTKKGGVVSAEIYMPSGVSCELALDREDLWNAAELAEVRKDARVAREFEVALPHELGEEERNDLVARFAQMLADRYGVAVDAAIHAPDARADQRNHHAHVLMSTRKIGPWGFGEKSDIERENKWLVAHGKETSHAQLRSIRRDWEGVVNLGLQRAGHDVRVDHRSHKDRGIDLLPSRHVGVHATGVARQGGVIHRDRLSAKERALNAGVVRRSPEKILSVITGEKSVFTERDIRRALWRCTESKAELEELCTLVMSSSALVEVQGRRADDPASRPRYSTKAIISLETTMMDRVQSLQSRKGYKLSEAHVDRAVSLINLQLQRSSGNPYACLSDEQVRAVSHLAGPGAASVVIGHAGAGKSTMLAAAREAWESSGHKVYGGALAGKAAQGLTESSGIDARTLASWQRSWERGFSLLERGDVFVLDEAGMVGSRQMAQLVGEVTKAGAKLVLVGDSEQLQAIGPGGAFRAIHERIGAIGLEDIRRQSKDWQRWASADFASHKTSSGLKAYDRAGALHFVEGGGDAACQDLVSAYMRKRDVAEARDILVMAHRRNDVAYLNAEIREACKIRGWIGAPDTTEQVCSVETREGPREFVVGDRFLFLENDRDLGVKNGMLGTVSAAGANHLRVTLDDAATTVSIPLERYRAFDHGYATTIHKAQGATVQHALVLASETMDRHLTYVAMTRHKDSVALFADRDVFENVDALSKRLSRSGLKETSLDYLEDYAAAGNLWRVGAATGSEQTHPQRAGYEGPQTQGPSRASKQDRRDALERFGKAWSAILGQEAEDLPVLEAQRAQLSKATAALIKVQDDAVRLLRAARKEDAELARKVLSANKGSRAELLESAITAQQQREADPLYRGEKFIERWKTLDKDFQSISRPSGAEIDGFEAAIFDLSREIARDPLAKSAIEAGLVKGSEPPEPLKPFSTTPIQDMMRMTASDLLRGIVPARYLSLARSMQRDGPGMSRDGPSMGM